MRSKKASNIPTIGQETFILSSYVYFYKKKSTTTSYENVQKDVTIMIKNNFD